MLLPFPKILLIMLILSKNLPATARANIIRAFMSSLLSLDDCAFHAYSVTAGSATFLNFNVILGPTDSQWKPGER